MKAAVGIFVIFALCHFSFANENGKKCRAEAQILFGTFNTVLQSKNVCVSSIDITPIEGQDDISVQKMVLYTDPIVKSYLKLVQENNIAADQAAKTQIIDAVNLYVKNLEAAGIENEEIPMINVLTEFQNLK